MVYSKDNPYFATLKERFALTKKGSTKSCIHLELGIDPKEISFIAGDSVGILPDNAPQIVQKIIALLKAEPGSTFFSVRYNREYPLIEFLTKKANLAKVTNSLFQWLFEKASPERQKPFVPLLDKKAELTELLHSYEVWDLLEELAPAFVPIQEFCGKLLPQMPRFYSIASSPKAHPDEIHLTVAELSFTSRGHNRLGVASHYLSRIADIGETIPLYIQPSHGFTLPLNPQIPIIMIGPGTGIAPFRAFLQERSLQKDTKNWLFFGERNRQFDFYYQHYLEELEKKNHLRLSLAFSRDQSHKIYVQNRLLELASEIWGWIQNGAHIYVCGDASQMAKDVDLALQDIVHNEGSLPEDTAAQYLKDLRLQKRYLLDVY